MDVGDIVRVKGDAFPGSDDPLDIAVRGKLGVIVGWLDDGIFMFRYLETGEITCPTLDEVEPVATAWDAAGDWGWVGKCLLYIEHGRVGYEDATACPEGRGVYLRRLRGLHQIKRYVNATQPIKLREIGA